MPIKVNLLPTEQRVGKGLQRVLRITRMLGVISLGVFIVFSLALGGFFIFKSVQLSDLKSTNASLASKIAGLETSETKMVLLKDRLGKIKSLQNIPTSLNNLNSINSLLEPAGTSSTVNDLSVAPNKVSASINFKNNTDLDAFLSGVSESTGFKTVSLSSFSFNPTTGYLVNITAVGK